MRPKSIMILGAACFSYHYDTLVVELMNACRTLTLNRVNDGNKDEEELKINFSVRIFKVFSEFSLQSELREHEMELKENSSWF